MKGKTLILTNNEELSESHEEEDIDVPVEIEETFEELFELVQDKVFYDGKLNLILTY